MMEEPVGGRRPELRVYDDLAALSAAVADALVRAAEAAVAARGRFDVALAGGETPRALYRVLAERYADRAFWGATHVYFGDERCVPPDDAASNYAMAERELLSRVALDDARVHRIVGEAVPDDGARSYDALLRRELRAASSSAGGGAPTFDVALLGVGADGHTASLFPGDDAALDERERWALAVHAPPAYAPRDRITLTLGALNAARAVWVMAAGAGKSAAVRAALSMDGATALPAALVRGSEETVWHLDRAAAEGLGTR